MQGSRAPESSVGRSTCAPTCLLLRQMASPRGPGESLERPGRARICTMNDLGLVRD